MANGNKKSGSGDESVCDQIWGLLKSSKEAATEEEKTEMVDRASALLKEHRPTCKRCQTLLPETGFLSGLTESFVTWAWMHSTLVFGLLIGATILALVLLVPLGAWASLPGVVLGVLTIVLWVSVKRTDSRMHDMQRLQRDERASRLADRGQMGVATILGVDTIGSRSHSATTKVQARLRLPLPGGESRLLFAQRWMEPVEAPNLQPGRTVLVRYMPEDPDHHEALWDDPVPNDAVGPADQAASEMKVSLTFSVHVDEECVGHQHVTGNTITIGTGPDCDVQIEGESVSALQAVIQVTESGELQLVGKGDRSDTFVNREKVEHARLNSGDLIGMGNVILRMTFPNQD